jgi:phage baseplate assembly protein W
VPTANTSVVYSDFLTNLDVHPVKEDLVRVVNEASVKRAIRTLLMLNKTERYFRSKVGSGVKQYLFEPMTPHTAVGLQSEITQVLNNYEPRITLVNVQVTPKYDQNAYAVQLVYYVINNPTPVSFNVTLERIQ